MAATFETYQKRRLVSSYISVVISIAFVMFLVGCLGLLLVGGKGLANYFKEQVVLTIYLKDSAKETEVTQLQNSLALASYVRSASFVSKEEAAEILSKDIGEDFMEYLGYNPLQNSIDVHLKADFVSSDSIADISKQIVSKSFVEEVEYDKPLVDLLNENLKRIGYWVLVISVVFTLIAVLLINSSIRLAVYSKRFIIKTMQLVGATKGFIRKPFILHHVRLGVFGSLLAMAGMGGVLLYVYRRFPGLDIWSEPWVLVLLFAGVLLLGILISWISTFIATQRFLNLRTDDLYF